MTNDFLELSWRIVQAQDMTEDAEDVYYLYRGKTIEEAVDLGLDEEVIEIIPVAYGSTVQYMKENWGMSEMLNEIGDKLQKKIERDRTDRHLKVFNMEAVLRKRNPNEGSLQLMYEYNSFQSNRPDDPVEYDEHFELVYFVDELMGLLYMAQKLKQ